MATIRKDKVSNEKPLTTRDIEKKVAEYFGVRQNIIVPRVSWGFGIHECDLLIMTKSGYATEVEIKISKADLIKDKEKEHGHNDNRIKNFYFAIPETLREYIEHIPERAGIIVVNHEKKISFACETVRWPQTNKNPYKFTTEEMLHLAHLGCMRIWKNYKKN